MPCCFIVLRERLTANFTTSSIVCTQSVICMFDHCQWGAHWLHDNIVVIIFWYFCIYIPPERKKNWTYLDGDQEGVPYRVFGEITPVVRISSDYNHYFCQVCYVLFWSAFLRRFLPNNENNMLMIWILLKPYLEM